MILLGNYFIIFIGIAGYHASLNNNKKLLIFYTIFVWLVLILMLTFGIYFIITYDNLGNVIQKVIIIYILHKNWSKINHNLLQH
jgi:hypothetical protein